MLWCVVSVTLSYYSVTHLDEKSFKHREFAFQKDDGSFWRYLSFESYADLKQTVLKECPKSINVGL